LESSNAGKTVEPVSHATQVAQFFGWEAVDWHAGTHLFHACHGLRMP